MTFGRGLSRAARAHQVATGGIEMLPWLREVEELTQGHTGAQRGHSGGLLGQRTGRWSMPTPPMRTWVWLSLQEHQVTTVQSGMAREEKGVVPAWYSGSPAPMCTRIMGLKYIILNPTHPAPRETLFQEVQSGTQEAAFYFSGARVMLPQGIPEPCT